MKEEKDQLFKGKLKKKKYKRITDNHRFELIQRKIVDKISLKEVYLFIQIILFEIINKIFFEF